MLIITTVFCVNQSDLEDVVPEAGAEDDDELCAEDRRELLSIYQGKNRMLPIDWFD